MVEGGSPERDCPARVVRGPTFYFTNPYALIGAHDEVRSRPARERSTSSSRSRWWSGRDGASLTPEQARDHVFGYTILNDWSARDLQRPRDGGEARSGQGQGLRHHARPWLVTADELEPYATTRVPRPGPARRGQRRGGRAGPAVQHGLAVRGAHRVRLAQHRVRAGDVLGSGTCGNGGCLAELWGVRGSVDPPPLQPGDVVEMTVEGIGTIRNRVVAGPSCRPSAQHGRARASGSVRNDDRRRHRRRAGPGRRRGTTAGPQGARVLGLDLATAPAEDLPMSSTVARRDRPAGMGRIRP